MARAVGCGVTAFGTGVVHGSKAVGTGVVQGSKAVGTGVFQGTKEAGKLTMAAGKTVCHAGEVVGNAAVSGVTVIGSSTVQAGKAVTSASVNAVQDTTKWVKEQAESLSEDQIHVVLPGETFEAISEQYHVREELLIKMNMLNSRTLRTGKQLVIPQVCDFDSVALLCHPLEELTLLAVHVESKRSGTLTLTPQSISFSYGDDVEDDGEVLAGVLLSCFR